MSRVHYPTPNNRTLPHNSTDMRHATFNPDNMGYQSYGGHSDRETPGPIPNPEVKPASADGTAPERWWESRTPPNILCEEGHQQWWPCSSFPALRDGGPAARRPQRRASRRPVHRRAPRVGTVGAAPPWDAEVMDVKTDKKVHKASTGPSWRRWRSTRCGWSGGCPATPRSGCSRAGTRCGRSGWSCRGAPGGRTKQSVDVLDCAVWGGRVRASVASWSADDVVEVAGPLRTRFFSSGGGPASRVEVEVTSGGW